MLAIFEITQTGTLYVYQGQELGLKNFPRTWGIEEYKDVASQNYWNLCVSFPFVYGVIGMSAEGGLGSRSRERKRKGRMTLICLTSLKVSLKRRAITHGHRCRYVHCNQSLF